MSCLTDLSMTYMNVLYKLSSVFYRTSCSFSYLRMASSWLVVMFELQSLAMLSLLRAAPVMAGGTPLKHTL